LSDQLRLEPEHREPFEVDGHVSRINLAAVADATELMRGYGC